jgi:phenylalanyl-tRNA synthetase beta chain
MTPAKHQDAGASQKEKIAAFLSSSGFMEIMTNSITNSAFYGQEVLNRSVKMLNSLSAELDIMRPSLLESGLQALAYNLNRRQSSIRFFEFGRSYISHGAGAYEENEHLSIYVTGNKTSDGWQGAGREADFYFCKGLLNQLLSFTGIRDVAYKNVTDSSFAYAMEAGINGKPVAVTGAVSASLLKQFDIKQPVFYIDVHWDEVLKTAKNDRIRFTELPKQLPVHRDLSMLLPKSLPYDKIEQAISGLKLKKLQKVELFDVFESEKLGAGKKSVAISIRFLDEEKTLTDKEVDGMMNRIIQVLSEQCQAEIRK